MSVHVQQISPVCPPPTQAGEGAPGSLSGPAGGSEDAHAVRLGGAR